MTLARIRKACFFPVFVSWGTAVLALQPHGGIFTEISSSQKWATSCIRNQSRVFTPRKAPQLSEEGEKRMKGEVKERAAIVYEKDAVVLLLFTLSQCTERVVVAVYVSFCAAPVSSSLFQAILSWRKRFWA